ncbi:hypothetical protein D3C71_1437650 [compost metagenome]
MQQRQGFAGAHFGEFLVLEPHHLAQAVVEQLGAEFLHHQPRHIFLQRLGQARAYRHRHGQPEQAQHAGNQFLLGLVAGVHRIAIDDLAEDDGIDQCQHLADGRQQQRQPGQPPMGFEIGPENMHSCHLSPVRRALAVGRGRIARRRKAISGMAACLWRASGPQAVA